MSIQSQVQRLETAKAELAAALEAKGVPVPKGSTLDKYAPLVEQIKPVTTIPASNITDLEGTDYTTNRPRGIVLQAEEPGSVPNGCLVGVYE